jgi:hypothetical protein
MMLLTGFGTSLYYSVADLRMLQFYVCVLCMVHKLHFRNFREMALNIEMVLLTGWGASLYCSVAEVRIYTVSCMLTLYGA